MKGKSLGLIAMALLLSNNGSITPGNDIITSVEAHRLSEAALAWNSISSNSHSHSTKHKKKSHKKKHHKKHKHEEESESEEESENEEKPKDENKTEEKADDGAMI